METIDHIVKEIRGNAEHNHALVEVTKYLTEIADRIEAAYNRLALPTPDQWTQIAQQTVEISELKRKNAHLRAALTPIQECKTFNEDQKEHDDMPSYTVLVKCHNAVRAAQRLFNERKKESKK